MDRLEAIRNYRKEEDEKAKQEFIREMQVILSLRATIRTLKPRIDKLIETANVCLENQIWFDTGNSYNKEDGYLADGITHKIGFIQNRVGLVRNRPINCLGIRGGGWCGNLDFITNGEYMFMIAHYDPECKFKEEAPLMYLAQFVAGFDSFEKSFYAYIDSKIGVKE